VDGVWCSQQRYYHHGNIRIKSCLQSLFDKTHVIILYDRSKNRYMKLPLSELFLCGVLHIAQAPNFVGVPLGLAQMVLYCIYCNKKSPRVEDSKLVHGGKPLESIKKKSEEDIEMQLNEFLQG